MEKICVGSNSISRTLLRNNKSFNSVQQKFVRLVYTTTVTARKHRILGAGRDLFVGSKVPKSRALLLQLTRAAIVENERSLYI